MSKLALREGASVTLAACGGGVDWKKKTPYTCIQGKEGLYIGP